MDFYNLFIKRMEDEVELDDDDENDDDDPKPLLSFPKGQVPELPEYKAVTVVDNSFGDPSLERYFNYDDEHSQFSLHSTRCRVCGALQWRSLNDDVEKQRCCKCHAMMYYKTEDEMQEDWIDYWENKAPLEFYMKKHVAPKMNDFFSGKI
jgi:hypothetical protein